MGIDGRSGFNCEIVRSNFTYSTGELTGPSKKATQSDRERYLRNPSWQDDGGPLARDTRSQ